MQIIHTIEALRQAAQAYQQAQQSIAFVPTMGNLHAGHLHLVALAKDKADCVVVSIFVNPLQFGPNEDLTNYPRTFDEDCRKLSEIGATIVFAPNVNEMYPDFDGGHINQNMTINPPPIANTLCGAFRQDHFSGVATVVMKLFNIVQPNVAVFGKKDFQQLFIIKEMVRQFNLPIAIFAGETVREADGLALSSRNGYLKPMERSEASRLNKVLKLVMLSVQKAGKQASQDELAAFETQSTQYLTQLGWIVDYIAIRSANTLLAPSLGEEALVVLGAAKFGTTRLIDNIEFLR